MKKSLILILFAFLFLTVCPKIIYAADPLNLQIPIGNTAKVNFNSTTQPIADYISMIYKYAIGIVGILATVVMMYGGLLWIMAGGSQERVSNARSWIMASVTGLVLALTSYTILYTINPALVEFKISKIKTAEEIKDVVITNCEWTDLKDGTTNCEMIYGTGWQLSNDNQCYKNKLNDNASCCCLITGNWEWDEGIADQMGDASLELIEMLSCLRNRLPAGVGRISSISDKNYIGNLTGCESDSKTCPLTCQHTCNSCHYGGGGGDNKSYAVDLGDEENWEIIKTAISACDQYVGYYINEGNHIHISSSACPRK